MAITKAEPGKTRIGWVGTGVMGRWMCQHLLTKGFKATVYNRTKDKAKPLLEQGAAWADTPKQVAEKSDVVFAIVGFPKDVREVFLGPQGALAGSKAGTVLVDMTTSEPSLAREIYDAAKAKGVYAVDAPVSGGDIGARNAALSIMVGGDVDAVEALKPCFEFMGKSGRVHRVKLSDRRLARVVKACQDIPGQELFQYLDEDGTRHAIESSDVNSYIREVSGADFSAKDFRTWNGTVLAARYLRLCDQPTSATAGKRQVSGAIKSVAAELGNTPAVCRKAYVHPVVVNAYLEGSLEPEAGVADPKPDDGLTHEEQCVLTLLHAA